MKTRTRPARSLSPTQARHAHDQVFLNLGNNGRPRRAGLLAVRQVTSGMSVVIKLYGGYGEPPTRRAAADLRPGRRLPAQAVPEARPHRDGADPLGRLLPPPVPIYEYVCMECESHFEELVRGDEQIVFSDCAATNVSRQISTFAVHGMAKQPELQGAAAAAVVVAAAPAPAAISALDERPAGEQLTRAEREQLEAELASWRARGGSRSSRRSRWRAHMATSPRTSSTTLRRTNRACSSGGSRSCSPGCTTQRSSTKRRRRRAESSRWARGRAEAGGRRADEGRHLERRRCLAGVAGRPRVLGKKVGDQIVVEAPRGTWSATSSRSPLAAFCPEGSYTHPP